MVKAKKNKGQSVRITVSFAVKTNPFDRQLWELLNDDDSNLLDKLSLKPNDSISLKLKRIALSVINNEISINSVGVETTQKKEPITTTIKEEKTNKKTVKKEPKNNLLNPLDAAPTLNLDDLD